MKYLTLPTFLLLSSVILVSICLPDSTHEMPNTHLSVILVSICLWDSTCEIPNFTHLSTVEFCYFGQYLSVGLYM